MTRSSCRDPPGRDATPTSSAASRSSTPSTRSDRIGARGLPERARAALPARTRAAATRTSPTRASPDWQYTMVRVRPDARRQRRRVRRCSTRAADEARRRGKAGHRSGRSSTPTTAARAPGPRRCGFRETRQDVELLRQLQPGDGEIAGGHRPDAVRSICAAPTRSRSSASRTCRRPRRWRPIALRALARADASSTRSRSSRSTAARVVGYATLEHLHGDAAPARARADGRPAQPPAAAGSRRAEERARSPGRPSTATAS